MHIVVVLDEDKAFQKSLIEVIVEPELKEWKGNSTWDEKALSRVQMPTQQSASGLPFKQSTLA
jgi:hypothetical protein